MKKSRFTDSQIIAVLKRADTEPTQRCEEKPRRAAGVLYSSRYCVPHSARFSTPN